MRIQGVAMSFHIQWQFWADEWISVGFFDDRDAAGAYMDSIDGEG